MTLVFTLLLALGPGESIPDLGATDPLGHEEVKLLMSEGCEHGTVVAPSDERFEGKPGDSYTACYRSDHELIYTSDGEVLVGWWHLTGPKDAVALCRGSDPRRVACRVVKRAGDELFGVGVNSGAVRYRFTISKEPE